MWILFLMVPQKSIFSRKDYKNAKRLFFNINKLLLWQLNMSDVMPDLIRHPDQLWIPAFAGMTALTYIVAGVITLRALCLCARFLLFTDAFSLNLGANLKQRSI